MTKIIPKPRVSTRGCLAALFTTRNRGYAITALLLIISACIPACSTARLLEPRSEPVAQLIDLLADKKPEVAANALSRLQAVSEEKFRKQQEWQAWYKQKVATILKQLVEEHKSFPAILEAGKYKIKEAVPILGRCLDRYIGKTIIYGFAAAQALYLIDTPEAHKILRKYLAREDYGIEQSIGYMYHWNVMPQDAIDSFIKDYHLSSTSYKLKVKIECSGKYNFKVSVTNVSEDEILTYGHFILLFCSPDGHFLRRKITKHIDVNPVYPRPRKPLKPGETKASNMRCKVGKIGGLVRYFRDYESNRILDEEDGSYGYILSRQGTYEVYAIYSFPRRENVYHPWPKDSVFGRWVSEPIKVKIEW